MLTGFNTHLRHAGRPLVLLAAAGMIAGSALLTPRFGTQAATAAVTKATSCSTNAFQPLDSVTTWTIGSARVLYRTSGSGGTAFRCALQLPPGAIVTKFQITGADFTSQAEMGACNLRRMSMDVATAGDIETMATTAATGGAAAPGKVRLTDDTVALATVKGGSFAYYVQCEVTNDSSAGPIGATVFYTV